MKRRIDERKIYFENLTTFTYMAQVSGRPNVCDPQRSGAYFTHTQVYRRLYVASVFTNVQKARYTHIHARYDVTMAKISLPLNAALAS